MANVIGELVPNLASNTRYFVFDEVPSHEEFAAARALHNDRHDESYCICGINVFRINTAGGWTDNGPYTKAQYHIEPLIIGIEIDLESKDEWENECL